MQVTFDFFSTIEHPVGVSQMLHWKSIAVIVTVVLMGILSGIVLALAY